MKRIKILCFCLLSLSLLTSCSGGSGSAKATAKAYRLYPHDFLSASFSENYSLTGRDQIGIFYDGTFLIQTQPESSFDGSPSIPTLESLSLRNMLTNASFEISSFTHYSTSTANLLIQGFVDSNQGLESVSQNTSVIPETAFIGNSGDIGTYTDNTGNTSIYTWHLEKAPKGKADFIIESTITDQFDVVTAAIAITYRIDTEGNRSAIEIFAQYFSQGLTLELYGDINP